MKTAVEIVDDKNAGILTKEKLNMCIMIDEIEEAYDKKDSHFTFKRRINKLRKYIETLSI